VENNAMLLMKNAEVDTVSVKAIEGQSIYGGELHVKPMMKGDEMVFMEVHYAAGVGAPPHVHSHESMIYVVRGKVKTVVGDEEFILEPGDVCRHPAGVAHGVEAIEDSVMVEIKAPAPEMSSFFQLAGEN
jgi:quercetin dioxygenase-like cupin family protein